MDFLGMLLDTEYMALVRRTPLKISDLILRLTPGIYTHLASIRLSESMCDCCDVLDLVHASQQVRSAKQRSRTHLSSIES
jgi:hypothetical protein